MSIEFKIARTTAKFSNKYQGRIQGSGDNKAFDLSFHLTTSADLLPTLLPAAIQKPDDEEGPKKVHKDDQKDRIVQELFSVEGYVKRPYISPITIHRKPEGLRIWIWDQEDFSEALELYPCSMKNLKVELQSPHQIVFHGLIQCANYNNNELIRINAIIGKQFDIAWEVDHSDLFGSDYSEGESEEENEDSEQQAS